MPLNSPLPLISFETIMTEPLPPVLWEVEPLIAQCDRVLFYGRSGSLKSWLLLHLGLHLAAGSPWLGKFDIPEPRRVLYIDEEMNERTLRRCVGRLGIGAGFEDYRLTFQALSRVGVRFDGHGAEDLLRALDATEFDPEVVIVEALRRVLDGNENEAKDVSAFWRNVEPIVAAGKTLIISHHMRKGSKKPNTDSFELASGSTDLLAGVDTAFAIKRDAARDVVTVEPVKAREVEEPEAFIVSLIDEGGDSPIEMRLESFMGNARPESSKGIGATTLILAFLSNQPEHTAKRAEILGYLESCGVTKRTGERAIEELWGKGHIHPVKRGYWQLMA
jgi:hypothetical protein